MIDFTNIEKYRENNRIEAKKAIGGLPLSIWETYSAFANTFGGVILLGVEEHEDKSLHPVDLPDPEDMVDEFWTMVKNDKKVSVNILSDKNVSIHQVDGKKYISIEVPPADRREKPVYIDGNPLTGSYRRSGEGDYKCTREEVYAMARDAAAKTQDMLLLEEMDMDVLDMDCIHRYRSRMKRAHPDHAWETLEDTTFLYKLGAAGRDSCGKLHPTAAGLLMFGYEYEIVKEYPHYFLDYQEHLGAGGSVSYRTASSSGDWTGNVYDFYIRVSGRIAEGISVNSSFDPSVQEALHEALANCLVNADYYGRQGIVIIKDKSSFSFSNPGGFRVDIKTAKSGHISDPRNAALVKMFNMVDIGKRAGSGIPNIYSVWKKHDWSAPEIIETIVPPRTSLYLHLNRRRNRKAAVKIAATSNSRSNLQKAAIIEYLTDKVIAGVPEIAGLLGVKETRAARLLNEMANVGVVTAEGENENRAYRLKM